MKKRLLSYLAISLATLVSANAFAEGVALGVKAGTGGLGIGLTAAIAPYLNVRAEYNGLSYDRSDTLDDVDYDALMDLSLLGLLADWHPFSGGFRVTAGVYQNGNEFRLEGTLIPGNTYDIGDTQYTALPGDQLNATVDFNSAAPYLGLGWGNAVAASKHWGFNIDLGVMFQGTPKADLEAKGVLANPVFANDVATEEQNLNDEIKDFTVYPLISAGISYQF